MSYFTAVLASDGRAWRARDVDVDDVTTLDELADCLRSVAHDEHPVLAVVEHEDEWFALVRVEGDEEPRLFVSDLPAASRSHFGELLAVAADVDVPEDDPLDGADGRDEDGEASPGSGEDEEAVPLRGADAPPPVPAWAGDTELLEDFGVPGRRLRGLAEERSDDPAGVLGEIGDEVGFADLLEALR